MFRQGYVMKGVEGFISHQRHGIEVFEKRC
jgi:hypothetical protein